ncbi:ATP-binding protein [Xenorhabdus bovienii]|uniref:ATP-binding protein n=1 Tax=Xenorhabdus bovienii TaxID=40576 RepID=UPI00237C87DE|nr:ATP-binding protein [Xenorhabdus bovienii]MDE1476234.1 ATP-binding protein [Xenorhabdus bovienii]MDE1484085.1 ATP-binding protein [Xenorhabdus bovienii]MDE9437498.1 ATP-binding protein [Xenorhabdus bovienii]MDE9443347.1 ATP-binding protein [Xenorhabdus bovienii]MDE9483068.1 ATP-binding protein [Xenorhabdus bovienii]
MNATQLRNMVVQALMGKTSAQSRVYSPRDWSTRSDDYPCLLVQTKFDHKRSLGRNVPQFHTITTIRIIGRTEEFDGESDDGAVQAELALEALREQIERAVINSYELTRVIQQYAEIRSQIDIHASGESHMAQLLMDIDIEYYQGEEDFYPIETHQLDGIDVTVAMPAHTPEPKISINLE